MAWEKASSKVCGVCGDGCTGAGASRANGCGGGYDIAVAVGTGEIGDGSGRDIDGIRGSGSLEEAEDAWGAGGGLGAAAAEDRSRFVVMATDMIIGGGVTGAV